MPEPSHGSTSAPGDGVRTEDLGHPRGTLVIVIAFALLFGVAWLGVYLFTFLGRGAPHA